METFTKEHGRTIKCMEKENFNGMMDDIMKESMLMIKKKVMVVYRYLMDVFMKDNGRMEFSMEQANIEIEVVNGKRVYGIMGRISNDLIYNYDDDHLQKFPFFFEY